MIKLYLTSLEACEDYSLEASKDYSFDYSRLERNRIANPAYFSTEALVRNFNFQSDADDGETYGIDVSHHKGTISWSKIAKSGVKFAYIKATQGQTFIDNKFQYNFNQAKENNIPAGAYHFLSTHSSATKQADHFLNTYNKVNSGDNLPPVLDLEWDYNSSGHDNWSNFNSDKIITKCLLFLERIENELNQRPIIYTNKGWWESILGSNGSALNIYPIWMSRYGKYNEAEPPLMSGFDWLMWQFTDKGSVDGINGYVDVNVSKPELLLNQPPLVSTPCDLTAYEKNNNELTKDESLKLFNHLRTIFGGFNQAQVDFLNILIGSASPASIRSFIKGSVEPQLTQDEKSQFTEKANNIFSQSASEVETLATLMELAQPSAIRRCIIAES